MPRQKSYTSETLIEAALPRFWHYGYEGTSMADLVQVTGVSRHGIYEAFQSKHGLFLACLAAYQEAIVTPAFAEVEGAGAGFAQIQAYFEIQIEKGMAMKPSPPGCLIANTMTELGPHDEEIAACVDQHHKRLTAGFANAVKNEAADAKSYEIKDVASFLTVSAQGLWSFSRTVSGDALLKAYATTLISLVKQRLSK